MFHANGRTNGLCCLLWISGVFVLCMFSNYKKTNCCFVILKHLICFPCIFDKRKKKIEILHSNVVNQSVSPSNFCSFLPIFFFRWLIGISTNQKCLVLCFNLYWTSHLSIPARLKQSENEHNRTDDDPKSRNQKKKPTNKNAYSRIK